jgi:hypothetical protein
VQYNCALIKREWLAAFIALRVVGAFLLFCSGVGVQFAQSSSQWEEISQTPALATSKKQGNLD